MKDLKKLKRNMTEAMFHAKMMDENRNEATFQNVLINNDNLRKLGVTRRAKRKRQRAIPVRLKHLRKNRMAYVEPVSPKDEDLERVNCYLMTVRSFCLKYC